MSDENKTYSIQLRLRREVSQAAYVAVFVDEKVLTQQEDGSLKLDFEKLTAKAIRISNDPRMN